MIKSFPGDLEEFLKNCTVVKDPESLSLTFLPPVLLHRDGQIQELTSYFKPLLARQQVSCRIAVTGPAGTGKTTIVKHALARINEIALQKNIRLNVHHVNCLINKTTHSILASILAPVPCFRKWREVLRN